MTGLAHHGDEPLSAPSESALVETPMLRFWVVQDYRENRKKCSVEPLRGLPGIELLRLRRPRPGEPAVEAPRGIVLTVEAPELAPADAEHLQEGGEVIVLDASWARLEPLSRRMRLPEEGVVRRSLPEDLLTAYPRTSKLHEDPRRGLATVEAMFATTVLLGEPRTQLLESYRWAEPFLELNRGIWERCGWEPPGAR